MVVSMLSPITENVLYFQLEYFAYNLKINCCFTRLATVKKYFKIIFLFKIFFTASFQGQRTLF